MYRYVLLSTVAVYVVMFRVGSVLPLFWDNKVLTQVEGPALSLRGSKCSAQ